VLKVSVGHALMYWQSETADVTAVQLAPCTVALAAASPVPVAVAPASALVEIDGTTQAGEAATASANPPDANATRISRSIGLAHHTPTAQANFLPGARSRTVSPPR
jgi:hypothetical protein